MRETARHPAFRPRSERQETLDSSRATELLLLRSFEEERKRLLRNLWLRVDELERYLSVAGAKAAALAAAAAQPKRTPDESRVSELK